MERASSWTASTGARYMYHDPATPMKAYTQSGIKKVADGPAGR